MYWTHFKRILRSGLLSYWRNKVVAITSLLVMTVSLLIIGSLFLGAAFLRASLAELKDKVDISVSFEADALEADVLVLRDALKQLSQVKEVEYLSREQELDDFITRHQDNTPILQSLNEVGNPFGARLNIKATEPSMYRSVEEFLKNKDDIALGGKGIVDQISFKRDVVDRLVRFTDMIEKIGWAVSLFLIIISVFVTFNTISLAIYTAREEISVMQLVGAGGNYIRGPFVIEGLISGVIASILAMALLYPATLWVRNTTLGLYGGIDLLTYYFHNFVQIFFILLVSGLLIGGISSLWAIRKYLRV